MIHPGWELLAVTMQMSRCGFPILLVLAFALPAAAELSPEVYRGMQKAASEYLEIEIVSVTTSKGSTAITVSARAKIVGIHRTASELKIGQEIQIEYAHDTRKMIGPRPIPVVKKGGKHPAFLSKNHRNPYYEPAARGFSFEVVR